MHICKYSIFIRIFTVQNQSKMATFRRIELRVELTSSYGRYVVSAHYKGEDIKAVTTDAEIYDWLDDDSNREKHRWAKRAAYELIVREYKQIKFKN